ncbi:Breast cancer 1, early onset [Clonorchis sinensis]|uniref:Breast cancer 1, early onset n=1 Tax=Clonorchis sinensis TaxID=79923 RepID=A0A419Q431_CLOSI|nr:Breast cancer 1, early onset [Clonorchis sinensis]
MVHPDIDYQTTRPDVSCSDEHHEAGSDLSDLFSFTQATQPMRTSGDESTSVGGMLSRIFQTSGRGIKSRSLTQTEEKQLQSTAGDEIVERSRNKVIRTVPFLPPLPPSVSSSATSSLRNPGSRKNSNTLSASNIVTSNKHGAPTEFFSGHAYLRKTHEVLCRVQPTVVDRMPYQEDHNPGSLIDFTECGDKHSGLSEKLKRQPSASCSVRSWPMKRQRLTLSVEARNRLLQKYGVTRRSVIEGAISSTLKQTTKSPGWSRWHSMRKELQRRSSSTRLSFRSKSCASLQPKEPSRSQGVLLPKNVGPNRYEDCTPVRKSLSRHDKLRLTKRDSQSATFNLSRSSISSAAEKLKPCKFVIPLRRIFSSKRSRVSLPLCTVPVVQVGCAEPRKVTDHPNSMTKTHTSKPPSSNNLDDHELSLAGGSLSFLDDVDHTHVHCSACGETLLLRPDSFSAFNSPGSRNTTNQGRTPSPAPRLSCSISSTYWQAEDPSDTMFDQAHGDTDDKNPFQELKPTAPAYAEKAVCDTACQTGLSQSPDRSPLCELFSTTGVETHRSQIPAVPALTSVQSPLAVTTTAHPRSPVSISPTSSALVKDTGSSESPCTLTNVTSTFPASSSEVMPTIDRERLRTECNELEAVVAALQQQLEEQVGELSPNTTAELLRAAGTEPMDADEDDREVPEAHVSIAMKCPTTNDSFETKFVEGSGSPTVTISSPSLPKSSKEFDHRTIHRLQSEFFPSMIPGTCSSEAVDIIPSSQAEEELDHPVEQAVLEPVSEQNMIDALPSSSQSSLPVTRVEASQPPTSYVTSAMCEFNPLVSTSSQNLVGRLANSAYLSECPETNLESQANTLHPLGATGSTEQRHHGSSKVPPSALVITGSSLSGPDMTLLHLFCRRFEVSEGAQFVPGKTTHVVMRSEADRPRVVKRTLKYFMAILNRAWIVNTDWIRQCLAANRILDETPFEIEGDTVCGDCHEGPRRGRLNVPAQPQPLDLDGSNNGPFAGLWLCAYESLGLLSLADFKRLATDGGATRVLDKPIDLAEAVNQYVNAQLTRPSRPRAIILTSHDAQGFTLSKCQEVYRIYGFPIISVDWMLNCISLFRRIPISQTYRICPAPGEQPAVPLSTRNRPQ